MIPEISLAVIETVNHEIRREGPAVLARKLEELQDTQPLLYEQIAGGLQNIQHFHGVLGAEVAGRLCVIIYKMIEAQIEAEQLEEP